MIPQSIQKILIYLSVAALIVYLGYHLITLEPTPNGSTDTLVGDSVGQEITGIIDKLQNVSIDRTILTSSVFKSLVDYNVVLIPENQGKPNPFLNYSRSTINQTTLPPSRR